MSTARQRAAAMAHVNRPRTRRQAEVDLTAAIRNTLDAGGTIPCSGGADWWISESAEAREYAVGLCQECPIRLPCHRAAVANRERFGVWGGVDRTPPRSTEG